MHIIIIINFLDPMLNLILPQKQNIVLWDFRYEFCDDRRKMPQLNSKRLF